MQIDRLEVILEDHGAKLKDLLVRVTAIETKYGASDDATTIKAYIDMLKKDVAA